MTVKEKNKEKVIRCALDSFIREGIEASKVAEIAEQAGLTERSVFRYFETKADIVLAAVLLYWNDLREFVSAGTEKILEDEHIDGIEKIRRVLLVYSSIFLTSRQELIFIEEAEVYLYRLGKIGALREKHILDEGACPLANAIRAGAEDGSVRVSSGLKTLYYNSFDALLGILQKLSLLSENTESALADVKERLDIFCSILADAYRR